MVSLAASVAILAMAFQVGHFAEHAFQFVVWLLGDFSGICGRDTPWMSSWVTDAVQAAGAHLSPGAPVARQILIGVEVLHLIGNTIFLTGLVCLYMWLPSKWVRGAMYIEGFHLLEHISLTWTAVYVGKPIGLSTMFGQAPDFGREFAVGFRVSWHFVMNLFPMPFAMIGMMKAYDLSRRGIQTGRTHGAVLS